MSRARLQKEEKVKEIGERLAAAQATIFADYRGLSVQDLWDLRSTLAEADTRFSVVKNTLARLAVRQAGLAELESFLEGPTAVAYVAGDPVQGAKKLLDVTRRLPVLEVKGGLAEGRVLSADQVKALAALETREVMLAKLAGLAKSQMATAAWMFQALQSKFLAVLDAYKEKLPAEAAIDEPPAAAEEAPSTDTPEPSADEAVPQGPGGARGADGADGEGDPGEASDQTEAEGGGGS
jgi:large subunit ribosomal protein L10